MSAAPLRLLLKQNLRRPAGGLVVESVAPRELLNILVAVPRRSGKKEVRTDRGSLSLSLFWSFYEGFLLDRFRAALSLVVGAPRTKQNKTCLSALRRVVVSCRANS